MNDSDWFAQNDWRCRFAWGRRGAKEAAARQDVLVIVDVLSFSSAVATAVHHGGAILPCKGEEEATRAVGRFGGEVAVSRRDAPTRGRFSLSPLTYLAMEPGTTVALPSPNGATCCGYATPDSILFVGCLLNAQAVAEAVTHMLETTDRSVTVVACGERWQTPSEDGALRFAIEDYLGAGAVLAALPYAKSPEAGCCAAAFLGMKEDLARVLWECGSGVELRDKGYPEDVRHAAQWNLYASAPMLQGERLMRWALPTPEEKSL